MFPEVTRSRKVYFQRGTLFKDDDWSSFIIELDSLKKSHTGDYGIDQAEKSKNSRKRGHSRSLIETIGSVAFYKRISVLNPTAISEANAFNSVRPWRELMSGSVYYRGQTSLNQLFTHVSPLKELIDAGLIALSANTSLHNDNVVAIYPKGKLVLDVCSGDYTRMGLTGSKKEPRRKNSRYMISIDLREAASRPMTSKYMKRILQVTSPERISSFTLNLALRGNNSLSSVDIMDFMVITGDKAGFEERKVNYQEKDSMISRFLLISEESLAMGNETPNESLIDKVIEVVGRALLRIPEGNSVSQAKCKIHIWQGFLCTQNVYSALRVAVDVLKESTQEYVVIHADAFNSAPMTFKQIYYEADRASNHSITIVLFSSGVYWMLVSANE